MQLGELFMALGFDVDDAKLDSFSKKIDGLKTSMIITTAKVSGALWAIDAFVSGSIRSSAALANFNNQTELSTQKLQKWQAVAQMTNLAASAEEVLGSIKAVQDNLTQISLGGGNRTPFVLLGIDTQGKDAFDVLEQVRTRIKGLNRNTALNLLQQMGISPNMLETLQLTREEFSKMGGEFVRTGKTTETILRLGGAINVLKMNLSLWKDEFVSYVTPALLKGIDAFYRFKDSILNIKTAIDNNPIAWDYIKTGVIALAVALGTLWVALNPIKALFVALFFIIDDIASYLNGGDSIFGRVISQAKELIGLMEKMLGISASGGGGQSFNQFSPAQISLALARATPQQNSLNRQPNQVNNTFYVDGSKDPFTTATNIRDFLAPTLEGTLANINNAGR
jgi:hypothetical protein